MASPLQAVNVRATTSAARPKRQQSWKLKNARATHAANDNQQSSARRAANDNIPVRYGKTQNIVRQVGRHRRKEGRESDGGITGTASTLKAKARAIRFTWSLAAYLLPWYGFQLLFGLVAFAGAGVEFVGQEFLWGAANALIPGEYIFVVGWFGAVFFSTTMICITAIVYAFNRVNCWDGVAMYTFYLFLALCFAPFVNIIPWFVFWMVFVVYAQK